MSEEGCFWIFHDWGKWEQYKWVGNLVRDELGTPLQPPTQYSETRQKRTCKRCGFMQDCLIKPG